MHVETTVYTGGIVVRSHTVYLITFNLLTPGGNLQKNTGKNKIQN